ncbi:MAG: S1 RNA-binding domain-containing protein, partial [Bifidobacteriaceae bacterium]|nr:S1 RNA-binding domain-containing protein [Bifidobacteriaceae bacterium]
TTTFGAFVSLTPGKDGLLHVSQIRRLVGGRRVENVEDVLQVGQKVQVEINEIDPRGKLSLHAVVDDADQAAPATPAAPDSAPAGGAEGDDRMRRRRERHHTRIQTDDRDE